MSGCQNQDFVGHPLTCSTGIFYENQGGGRYKAHENAGTVPTANEQSSAAGDVNGDGLLDLYVSEGLPAFNNSEFVGLLTSKLYINKVIENNGGLNRTGHILDCLRRRM